MSTALQILTAAMEEMSKRECTSDCDMPGDVCYPRMAREVLEAAAKAPGLADDEGLLTTITRAETGNMTMPQDWNEQAAIEERVRQRIKRVLETIDACQLGGK